MKKMKSAASIYLDKDWFGKIEEKPSSKKVNANRTASTIQFGWYKHNDDHLMISKTCFMPLIMPIMSSISSFL